MEPKPMSDEVTAAIVTRIEASLATLLTEVNNLVREVSHIQRTANENRTEIESLKNSREFKANPGEDLDIKKARLRLLAEIVVSVSAISALLLNLLGG